MPDVREVLTHRIGDVDLAQIDPESVGECRGVIVRAVRGTKARHGHRDDARTVKVREVEGTYGDEKGERGVKPTRDADHSMQGVRMYQALGQTVCLDGEDILAALGSPCGITGHEGVRVDVARETGLMDAQ